MRGGLFSGIFRYGESELDPAVHAEILVESARNEARVAILEIVLALGFGAFLDFGDPRFRAVALFAFFTVVPLLVDSFLRQTAAARLRRMAPESRGA